jgi:hypothetical protein
MLTRMIAAAALATLATAAQAGTLQNGTYTVNCTDPGDPPTFSSKSADSFNASVKVVQTWQAKAQEYQNCLNSEIKADQQIMIDAANANVKKLSDKVAALNAAQQAAVDKLKKASK